MNEPTRRPHLLRQGPLRSTSPLDKGEQNRSKHRRDFAIKLGRILVSLFAHLRHSVHLVSILRNRPNQMLFWQEVTTMSTTQTAIKKDVIDILTYAGPSTIGEVVGLLSNRSWYEVLPAIADLSQDGRLIIRRYSQLVSRYKLALSPSYTTNRHMSTSPSHIPFSRGTRRPLRRDSASRPRSPVC